jgi:hypothetical protein
MSYLCNCQAGFKGQLCEVRQKELLHIEESSSSFRSCNGM